MAKIRASCQKCGEVILSSKEIRLYVLDEYDYQYEFECPYCQVFNVRHIYDERIARLLISANVNLHEPLSMSPEVDQFDAEALAHAIESWRKKGAKK